MNLQCIRLEARMLARGPVVIRDRKRMSNSQVNGSRLEEILDL